MLKIYRQFLQSQNLPILCVRFMGKMDQFKWKPHKKKPNRNPKLGVILKQDMENLGIKGQMVNVERGYARNFLIPKNIAAYATKENMKLYLSKDTDTSEKTEAPIPGKFKGFLDRTHLKIERKEGDTFEIHEHHVALEYKRQYQLHVPAHCIRFREPMKSFGEYTVDVTVRDTVVMPMKVTVLAWKPRIPPRFQKALELETENKDQEQASAN